MTFNYSKLFGGMVSFSIVTAVILAAYLVIVPVDVLKDWSITTDKDAYQTSETIIITTRFSKVRNVTGISKRYIECESRNQSINRIPISEGDANRAPQDNANNSIYLRIPSNLPELPTTCHIEIVVEYNIYTFRKHTETTRTQDFLVSQAQDTKANPPVTQENDNQVVENSPSRNQGTARTVPNPAQPSQSEEVPEASPIIPPNSEPRICKVPLISLVPTLLGGCE